MIKNNSTDNLEIHVSADIYYLKYQTLFAQYEGFLSHKGTNHCTLKHS